MHRRDKRKTAQPTPLSIISRHPAVPPLLRCTRLPAVPSPFGCARYPAAPSLFGRNPIVPLCRPVQKQPAALQYRPVGRQLAALTCRPCTDTSSSPYYIVFVRISSTAPPHRSQTTPLPPIPLFGYSPVPPRCATPFGCAHCLAMPLLLTGSTRCPAIQKSPCCGVPVRIFPAVLPCRMTQRQLHCPVWVRHRFPRCTTRSGCALLHRYAADARKYACYPTISSVQKQSRCPLSILGRRSPPPPRCAATQWRHSGAAAPLCPTYFPSQTTRTGRFSFSVRPVFLWKFIGTALSFFRMDNDSQAAG